MWLPSVCSAVSFDRNAATAARHDTSTKGRGPPSQCHDRTAKSRCTPGGAPFPAIGENIVTTGPTGKNRPLPACRRGGLHLA